MPEDGRFFRRYPHGGTLSLGEKNGKPFVTLLPPGTVLLVEAAIPLAHGDPKCDDGVDISPHKPKARRRAK